MLSLKHKAKGQGASAKAHAQYVAREGKYAVKHAEYLVREGKHERRAHELEYLCHGNMPDWALENPMGFWEAADIYERANGRVYTEIVVSIPRELKSKARVELIRDFVGKELGERLVYTVAIHNPTAMDGGEQPHAHIMFSNRELDGIERSREMFFKRANPKDPERGGAKKSREWSKDSRENDRVLELRVSWERYANKALEQSGIEERIDMRSLKARGIEREPEPKMGPEVTQKLKRGEETEIGARVLELRGFREREREVLALERELKEERGRLYDFKEEREKRVERNEIRFEGEVRPWKGDYKGTLDLFMTRFNTGQGSTEFRWSKSRRLAFEDKGNLITFRSIHELSIRAGVERAEEKGWGSFQVTGSEEFQRKCFIEASLRGIKVSGYVPTDSDLLKVEELRAKRAPLKETTEKQPSEKGEEEYLRGDVLLREYRKREERLLEELGEVHIDQKRFGIREEPQYPAGYWYRISTKPLTEEEAFLKAKDELSGGEASKIAKALEEGHRREDSLTNQLEEFRKESGLLSRVLFTPAKDNRSVKSLLKEARKEVGKLLNIQDALERRILLSPLKEELEKRISVLLSEDKELQEKRAEVEKRSRYLREVQEEVFERIRQLELLGKREVHVERAEEGLYQVRDKEAFIKQVSERKKEIEKERELERSRTRGRGLSR
jgi:hypothetical protein